jgi:hypothetical protein
LFGKFIARKVAGETPWLATEIVLAPRFFEDEDDDEDK